MVTAHLPGSWPVTTGGWRLAAAAVSFAAFVACSGGPPPETAPGTEANEESPGDAPAQPAEAEAEARHPRGDGGQPRDDQPAAGQPPTSDQEPAARTPRLGELMPGVSLGEAAAAEQGPGFALPAAPEPPPTAAIPPTADSLELVDRMVAIVGDTVILQSEVREQIFQLQAQGLELPRTPSGLDSLAAATLRQMVEEMMIVQQAEFAGIAVTDEELDDEVDRRFDTIRSRFSSDEEMLGRVEASGQNMFQFRGMVRSQARKDILAQRYVQTQMASMPTIRISEREIQALFDQEAAGLTRPSTLDMVNVVIEPKPSEAARDSALAEARAALEDARSGEEFEVVARRYSDDQGTRDDGGDLGWIRRGEVVPAFGDAAWAVRKGIPIGPVESRFGFHIIKVENVRGGERRVRHILVRPVIEPEQVEAALELAGAIADSIRGGTDPTVMAKRYGVDPEDSRLNDLRVDRIEGAMGSAYASALRGATSGDVVGPFQTTGASGIVNFVVIKVIRYRPQGSYGLEELRVQIRDQLERQKQYEALVDQLRQEVYVRIMI